MARATSRALAGLLAALAAAACTAPGTALRAPAGATPRAADKAASPAATAKPAGAASAKPTPLASFAPVPMTLVRGRVRLDAAYMVAAGGGNLAGTGITASVTGLIGNDGSTLIGNDGSTLIGNDGSTLIGNDGSTLIGNDGSTLIGNDGSTLIGNDGSTLIGNDGSTLVGRYGAALLGGSTNRTFGLLQASAAPPAPTASTALPYGAERPAARMRVRIFELASGRPVLAARDPAAAAGAYVFTNADGTYEAPVRADAVANLLVYADVGGTRDPRLQYTDLLAARAAAPPASGPASSPVPPPGGATIDEHRSMTAYYIRLAVRERLRGYLATDLEVLNGPVKGDGLAAGSENQALLGALTKRLYDIARVVRLDREPRAVQDRVIQALQDLLLSNVGLEIPVYTGWLKTPYPFPTDQLAFDAMDQALAELIQGAAGKMNAPGGSTYFSNAAAAQRGYPPYYADVRKPADLGRVFIERFVAPVEGGIYATAPDLFADAGADPRGSQRFRVGADAFELAMLLPLALEQPPTADPEGPSMFTRVEAILRAKGQGLEARTIPSP